MNRKIREQYKIAKWKRIEAMIHGELPKQTSRTMEKYDVYLDDKDPELYKSYTCKEAVIDFAKRTLRETRVKVPKEGYQLHNVEILDWDSSLRVDYDVIPCRELVAEIQWIKLTDDGPYYLEDYILLCYYVEDSIEW